MEQEQLEEEKSYQSGQSNDCTDEISGDVVTPTGTRRPPHNYVYIVKDAVETFDMSSRENICERLYEGVLLDGGKKMYWVDSKLNKNCFMVLAKDLGIVHVENDRHWKWCDCAGPRNASIKVASLREVCWLEINGKFQTITLAPKTSYEVAFVVKMEDPYCNWNLPVNFKITFPDQTKEECTRSFRELPKEKWTSVSICKFTMSPKNVGEIAFSLLETSGQWKKGLVIKGVSFLPID